MISITDLIGDKGAILWWQMSIRAVLIFIFGLVLIRLLGRRVFGQQNPLDIVVAVVMGSSLSRTLTGNAPFFSTLAAITALLVFFWLLEHAAARWRLLGRLAKGEAVSLVRDHQFNAKAMRLWGVTEDDIAEAARASGNPDVGAVRDAMLERSGRINTIAES
jgi:uncharacterized membrane protein YcaP (DUF421 family)